MSAQPCTRTWLRKITDMVAHHFIAVLDTRHGLYAWGTTARSTAAGTGGATSRRGRARAVHWKWGSKHISDIVR